MCLLQSCVHSRSVSFHTFHSLALQQRRYHPSYFQNPQNTQHNFIPALGFCCFEISAKPKYLQLLDNPANIGQHIRKRRLEQNLKQAEVAKLIGVSEDCITLWENKRSHPQIKHYPKIIQFLGYNPFEMDTATLGGRIKKYRIENGLSIKKLAQKLTVESRTIITWENNTVMPTHGHCKKIKELIKR